MMFAYLVVDLFIVAYMVLGFTYGLICELG